MAIHSRINQYQGINSHFQSYAQHERDGWVGFHNTHIAHLAEAIDRLLPPGYEVMPERSLQIRVQNPETGQTTIHRPEPDLTIWETQRHTSRSMEPANQAIAVPVATYAVAETMTGNEETRLRAVVIHEITPEGISIPITRIELLSPTNKTGDNALKYLAKRDATLEAGTVLVEIDYLHEIDSIIPQVPGYASRQPGAYLYTIIVSDPRPSITEGQTLIYGFHVDEVIPPIEIPLAREERIFLSFAEVYNTTFSSLSAFSNRVDYEQEPFNMAAYSPEDQQRIRARMQVVIRAEQAGQDLAQGPFPIPQ